MERPKPPDPKTRKPVTDRPRVIVAGSRVFRNYDLLRRKLDRLLCNVHDPLIIHGGAKGADTLAGRWADWHWYTQSIFHPDWSKGPRGGILRNTEMAVYAAAGQGKGACIAFWNGESSGTAHMIETAKQHGLIVRVIDVEKAFLEDE